MSCTHSKDEQGYGGRCNACRRANYKVRYKATAGSSGWDRERLSTRPLQDWIEEQITFYEEQGDRTPRRTLAEECGINLKTLRRYRYAIKESKRSCRLSSDLGCRASW